MHTYNDLYDAGDKAYQAKQFETALDFFQQAQRIRQTDDCESYMACCYLALGNLTKAMEILDQIIARNSGWERPVFNLGRVYLHLQNYPKAYECFKRAEELNSQNEDVYYYLGVYYEKINDYSKASIAYKKSIELKYDQSEAHLNLGVCYANLDLYEQAIKEFEMAYLLDPEDLVVIRNLGISYYFKKRYEEALELFLKLDVDSDTEYLFDIARCYYRLNKPEASLHWLNKTISINPHHTQAQMLLEEISHD